MNNKVSLDFEFTQENKKALEELLKASGIRHFIIETKDYGNIDVVEYKEYLKLKEILDKIKEWLEEDLKQQYRDCGHRNNIIREVYNKLNELLEEIE